MYEIGNAILVDEAREIIGKLREAEIVLAQGASAAEAPRRIAVSEQIFVSPHAPDWAAPPQDGDARNIVG